MVRRRVPTRPCSCFDSHGFTLAESLATLCLVGMALALVASLASELSRNSRFHRSQQAMTQAALVVLEGIRSEVAQSVFVEPSAGVLRLRRIDPVAERFPQTAQNWHPQAAAQLVEVRYGLNGSQELTRSANGSTRVLVKEAAGFEAEKTESLVVMRLGLTHNDTTVWHRLAAYLPMEQAR